MDLKKVTVIVPCRNEEKFIEKVINSLLSQTYPRDKLEVLFIDGLSEDKTREIIKAYAQEYSFIKLIDNPYKFVPQAMNIGINNATGDIIVRMDAHSEYPKDYIEKLVFYLDNLKADNVGGIWITLPRSDSLKAKAIAMALAHPFGVGNSFFRIAKDLKHPIEVDTVPFGCYHKETLEKIGLYNERLIRNQDIELNKRIKERGGKIYLVPEIKIKYFARDNWSDLWRNNFANGKWVILSALYTKNLSSLSFRHFVPLLFIIYILLCILICFLGFSYCKLALLPIFSYFLLITFFSLRLSFEKRDLSIFPFLVISFLVLHFSYGLGSLYGIYLAIKEVFK